MRSIHVDIDEVAWESAVPFYGPGAVHEGKDVVQLKILCDRRSEGAGITWIVRFAPSSSRAPGSTRPGSRPGPAAATA